MNTRTRNLLAALKDVAWADGVLRPQEAGFFVDVVSRLELTSEEAAYVYRDVLLGDSAKADALSLEDDDKRWVLAFGYLMASADNDVDDREIAVLLSLAGQFGISSDDAQRIFADARSLARQ